MTQRMWHASFLVWYLKYRNDGRSKPAFGQQSIPAPTLPYITACRQNMKHALRERLPSPRGNSGLVQNPLCNLPVAGVTLLPKEKPMRGDKWSLCSRSQCHSLILRWVWCSPQVWDVFPRKAWFSEVIWFILDLKSTIQPSYWQRVI